MTTGLVHRLSSALLYVCGARRLPFGPDRATNLPRKVTCPACRARSAAFCKSAKARSAALL